MQEAIADLQTIRKRPSGLFLGLKIGVPRRFLLHIFGIAPAHTAPTVRPTVPLRTSMSDTSSSGRSTDAETSLPSLRDGATLWQALLGDLIASSIGVLAAEVWIRDLHHPRFFRPIGGFAVCPSYQPEDIGLQALAALADDECEWTHAGFGFVGAMWEDASIIHSTHSGQELEVVPLRHLSSNDAWLHDARTHNAAAAFSCAASVRIPASSSVTSGVHGPACLLIVYANSSGLLCHPRNRDFLAAASRALAAVAAMSRPRVKLLACKGASISAKRKFGTAAASGKLAERLRDLSSALESAQPSLGRRPSFGRRPSRMGGTSRAGDAAGVGGALRRSAQRAHGGFRAYARKWRGVRGAAAKPVDWSDRTAWETGMWLWIGSACALFVLDALSEYIEKQSGGQYFLLLGSFGALVAILFGAPHSSFAQPRSVIGANMIAASIAVCMHYLSSPAHLNAFPRRLAIAFAPATAIAVNHRLGLLHPPAAAAALIFVSGDDEITAMGWTFLLLPLLVGNAICLALAVAFNNLSSTRQYPLYWLGCRNACASDGAWSGTPLMSLTQPWKPRAPAPRKSLPLPHPRGGVRAAAVGKTPMTGTVVV